MNKYSSIDAGRRREQILRIVRNTAVFSQEELLALLAEEGIRVTQPTLSRDIKDLGLLKTQEGYRASDAVAAFAGTTENRELRLQHLLAEFVTSVERAGNLVIVRTPPAAAQPVARALDESDLPGVLGTIGGDDTIFLAVRTTSAAASLTRRLREAARLEPSARRTRA